MIENREPLNATAARWELTPAYTRKLCKDGRVPGAIKVGRDWWIPLDAVRPEMRKYGEVKAIKPMEQGWAEADRLRTEAQEKEGDKT